LGPFQLSPVRLFRCTFVLICTPIARGLPPERESSKGSPTPQYEGVLNMPVDLILSFRAQSSPLSYGMVALAGRRSEAVSSC